MPMIWTHIMFSEEVIDQTEKIVNFTLDEDYLIFGAQGDNLLEFTPFWSKDKIVSNKHSLKLVAKNSEENFIKLIKSTSYTNKKVTSYLIGYITYCFLEKHTIKYIDYFIQAKGSNKNTVKTGIDTLLMRRYHNLDTRKIPVFKEFKLGLYIDKDIKHTMNIINHYLANNLQKAYFHTLISLRWLFDPVGWKAKVFPSYTPLFDPHLKLTDNHNFLNESHVIWDEFNNDSRSFIEIYNQAKLEATNFLSHLVTYWEKNDEQSLDVAIQLLKDLNKKTN